jgi:hypothetical protein
MLTHQPLEGEDAPPTVLTGSSRPADAGEGASAVAHRVADSTVGDDAAVTDDHDGLLEAQIRGA